MWKAVSVDTITGVPVSRIPIADASWNRALSARGDGSVTVALDNDGLEAFSLVQLRDVFAHWRRTIVLEWDGVPKYAGVIVGRPYPKLGNKLTLSLSDLWSIFDRRVAVDRTHPNFEQWKVTYSSTSLETLAKRAVQRGTTGSSAPDISLPITLPADVAGSLSRTYYGYHAQTVGDVLRGLITEGVDVDFEPRWVGGNLNYLMRVGNPLAGSLRELHVTAPEGGVSDFGEASDGQRMANNSILIGEGSEQDMLIRSNRNLTSNLPLLDRIVSMKDVSTAAQAAAIANRGLVDYEFQTTEWSFKALMSGDASSLRIADTARLHFGGDAWIADGPHDRRIVSMSGSLSEAVTISVQPTGGA